MAKAPDWLQTGQGKTPRAAWSVTLEGPLAALHLARESGEVLAADSVGSLYRIDREGKLSGVTHGKPLRAMAWSDTGQSGAALFGENRLVYFDRQLTIRDSRELPAESLAVAVDAHGDYTAVSFIDSDTVLYDPRGKPVHQFRTLQALAQIRFVVAEPLIIGVGELGLLTCHSFGGKQLWQEKLFASVGDIALSGDGSNILLACFAMGVQCHDDSGSQVGSYQIGGTVSRIALSYDNSRMAAATIERHFYWLGTDGNVHWQVETPEDIGILQCDPLGRGVILGFQSGRLLRLDWDG
jgi:hypothetical protein